MTFVTAEVRHLLPIKRLFFADQKYLKQIMSSYNEKIFNIFKLIPTFSLKSSFKIKWWSFE